MDWKIVGDGNFRINRDAKVQRKTKDGWEDAKTFKLSTGYTMAWTMVNGKQISVYVHHLLGEAFIPEDGDKVVLVFKDNDPNNLTIENLERVDKSEFGRIMAGRRGQAECSVCGKMFRAKYHKGYMCFSCKTEQERKEQQEQREKERLSDIRKELKGVIPKTEREKFIVKERRKGKTLEEIGESLDLSKERISQILTRLTTPIEEIVEKRLDVVKSSNPNANIALVRERLLLGLNQTEASKQIGISLATLINYERDIKYKGYDVTLERLSNFYNISKRKIRRGK